MIENTSIEKELDSILIKMACFLNKHNVDYLYLGNPSGKALIKDDIDVFTNNIKKFEKIIYKFCNEEGLLLINRTHHSTGIRFDIASKKNDKYILFPGPDVLLYPTWRIKRDIGFSIDRAIENRIVDKKGWYTPSYVDSFVFSFIKCIDKGELTKEKSLFLSNLWEKSSSDLSSELMKYFTVKSVGVITNAAKTNNWTSVIGHMDRFYGELCGHKKIDFKRMFWNVKRILLKVKYPSGFFIVFYGPDGSGKSSVIDRLTSEMPQVFSSVSYNHLRPRIGCQSKIVLEGVSEPHSNPSRSYMVSFFKLVYFLIDYNLGFFIKILPKKMKRTLVIFDRYFDDIQIDPVRYRYSGPKWVVRIFSRFIPRPDIVVLLNAPANILQLRKKEVSRSECERQCREYFSFVSNSKNGVVIDATQDVDRVVLEVKRNIVDKMSKRMSERIGR